MLDVSFIHQQSAHVQTSQTQERPALPQRLRFYILSGSRTFMQAICVSDTHDSFLMHPQGWPQQHSLQPFCFFRLQKKKKILSWLKKSISCLRVLWIEERRRGGGGEGGGQRLWHYVAWNIFSCLIHETQSPPRVTMVATFSHRRITLHYVVCVCVRRKMIDRLTQANHLCACLLYALSLRISLYGRCCFIATRATQLFCLSPQSTRSLSFSFWPSTTDAERALFSCFVTCCYLLCVYFAGLHGVHRKRLFERKDTNWRESQHGNIHVQQLPSRTVWGIKVSEI